MRTIIAGPRDLYDEALVIAHIESCPFPITTVLCGMAAGVDTIGYRWAKSKGIPVEEYHAEWGVHGKAAGPLRNKRMIASGPGGLVLPWFGDSPGSADILRLAVKACLWIHELRMKR